IFTSSDEIRDRQEALRLGVTEYQLKPSDTHTVSSLVSRWVEKLCDPSQQLAHRLAELSRRFQTLREQAASLREEGTSNRLRFLNARTRTRSFCATVLMSLRQTAWAEIARTSPNHGSEFLESLRALVFIKLPPPSRRAAGFSRFAASRLLS